MHFCDVKKSYHLALISIFIVLMIINRNDI